MRWVPDWFPGAEWKRDTAGWRAKTDAMIDMPYRRAKVELARGSNDNILAIANIPEDSEEEEYLKMAVASLYPGRISRRRWET